MVRALNVDAEVSRRAQFDARKLRAVREQVGAVIERLLAFLDATDGDPDLEPELAGWEPGQDGREGFSDDEEPSLGSDNVQLGWCQTHDGRTVRDAGMDQRDWGTDWYDAEGEHDGCEPDVDDEPEFFAADFDALGDPDL